MAHDGPTSVGIVTPAYNHARFVADSIKSVLSQDYPHVRYVVVDDGSTDNSNEVINSISGDFEFVTQTNQGQVRTLNSIWQRLDTDYVGYLSADDILEPNAISSAVEILDSDDSIVCAFPNNNIIDENGRITRRCVSREFDLRETIVTQECYIGAGAIFRRSAFLKAGGWDPELRLAPDREFWIRLCRFGRIAFLPQPLAYYRIHSGSLSVRDISLTQSLEYINVLDSFFREDVNSDILEYKNEAYANAYLLIARNLFRQGAFSEGIHYLQLAAHYDRRVLSPSRLLTLARNVVGTPIRLMISTIRLKLGFK